MDPFAENPSYEDPFADRAPTLPPPPKGLLIIGGVVSIVTSAIYLIFGAFMLMIGSLVMAIFASGKEVVEKGLLSSSGIIAVTFTLLAAVGIACGALTIARKRWAAYANIVVQLLFVGAWSYMMVTKPTGLTVFLIVLDLAAVTLTLLGLKKLSAWSSGAQTPAVGFVS
jgi:hypothetical protein